MFASTFKRRSRREGYLLSFNETALGEKNACAGFINLRCSSHVSNFSEYGAGPIQMLNSLPIATQFAEENTSVIFHACQIALIIGLFEMNPCCGILNERAVDVL